MLQVFKKLFPAVALGVGVLIGWEIIVTEFSIPRYLFPSPEDIGVALLRHGRSMLMNLGITMEISLVGFLITVVAGFLIALIMTQSKEIENAVFPYVIIIQVTPIVALAPLIVLLVKQTFWALVLVSVLISIFPVISNTVIGLKSVPDGLLSVFELYGASEFQKIYRLRLMCALPYFMGSLRIASGLAIVGAVVGGFVAGSTGANSGLAYDILQDGYNLEIPQLFAAVLLLSVAGVLLFALLSFLNKMLLHKWHDSYISERSAG